MDSVAATFAMGVNDPTPAVRRDRANLSATISQYFINGIMREHHGHHKRPLISMRSSVDGSGLERGRAFVRDFERIRAQPFDEIHRTLEHLH